jgi:hypothetical protein
MSVLKQRTGRHEFFFAHSSQTGISRFFFGKKSQIFDLRIAKTKKRCILLWQMVIEKQSRCQVLTRPGANDRSSL